MPRLRKTRNDSSKAPLGPMRHKVPESSWLCVALASALIALIVLGPAFSSPAMAGDLFRLLKKPAPEPRFHPVYVIPHDVHARAFGYGVPSYNWGYFGARHGPTCVSSTHRGYYHDYCQWNWNPRY